MKTMSVYEPSVTVASPQPFSGKYPFLQPSPYREPGCGDVLERHRQHRGGKQQAQLRRLPLIRCVARNEGLVAHWLQSEHTMATLIEEIRALSISPRDQEQFNAWLDPGDALQFLEQNTRQNEFVVYANFPHVFMHAVAVPAARVRTPDIDDLLSWNFDATGTSGITYSFNPDDIRIDGPLTHTFSQSLDGATKLVFPRSFEARLGETDYFEALQEYVHVFGLHYLRERDAYCRLDERGDIEDVIGVHKVERSGTYPGGSAVTFSRPTLDEWMTLTDSVVVRTFDFTRFDPSGFQDWERTSEPARTIDGDLMCNVRVEPRNVGYARGVQLVRSRLEKSALFARSARSRGSKDLGDDRQASFIAFDLRSRTVREISTAPGATANYFEESDLPLEMSPAFFRPEVLHRYKADRDKYTLKDRSISCRGAWHLTTYDINDSGQVHTYIVYLSNLPYEEQLYWKAHNEPPKGPISRRALATDFRGEWDDEYDPLVSLKELLQAWDQQNVAWWHVKNPNLFDRAHYPVTTAADEWSNELMNLDQLLVEGFEERWLRRKAGALGRRPNPALRSLKLIEECLVGLGFDDDRARETSSPLHSLHDLRSKLKGHASGGEAESIKSSILSKHKSYNAHYRSLCQGCDEAVRLVDEMFAEFDEDRTS